jgi:hypothetical protein
MKKKFAVRQRRSLKSFGKKPVNYLDMLSHSVNDSIRKRELFHVLAK